MTSRRAPSAGIRVSAANSRPSSPKPWNRRTSGVGVFGRYAVGTESRYGCTTPAVVTRWAVDPRRNARAPNSPRTGPAPGWSTSSSSGLPLTPSRMQPARTTGTTSYSPRRARPEPTGTHRSVHGETPRPQSVSTFLVAAPAPFEREAPRVGRDQLVDRVRSPRALRYGRTGGGFSSSGFDRSHSRSMPSALVKSVWSPLIAS